MFAWHQITLCILFFAIKDSMDALQIYRAKESVENSFDKLKNQLGMKRLRIHTSVTMGSCIFLQFLALILGKNTNSRGAMSSYTPRSVQSSEWSLKSSTLPCRHSYKSPGKEIKNSRF